MLRSICKSECAIVSLSALDHDVCHLSFYVLCVDSLANDTFASMQLIYVQSRLTHITSSNTSIPIIMAQ